MQDETRIREYWPQTVYDLGDMYECGGRVYGMDERKVAQRKHGETKKIQEIQEKIQERWSTSLCWMLGEGSFTADQ